MTDICICHVIETCPEFSNGDGLDGLDGLDGYVDNALALQLIITMRGADVYKLSEYQELPYEMAVRLRLPRIQHTLMPHMIYATRITYLCCLGQPTLSPDPTTLSPGSNAERLLERVNEIETGLGA